VKQVIFDSAKTYNEIADAIFEGNADRAIAAVEKHLGQVERQLIARMV
jgi:DNA-binding FadR family transcriptional regulator